VRGWREGDQREDRHFLLAVGFGDVRSEYATGPAM